MSQKVSVFGDSASSPISLHTKVACISGSYSVDEKFSFLTNQMKFDAREKVNKEAGTRRMYSHAIFTPGHPGWLEKVEEENAKLRKKNAELEMDRAILKKAAAFFAKESE